MSRFICPLPFNSISLESGYKSRICCHDLSGETDELSFEGKDKLHQKVRAQMLNGEIPENCKYCKRLEDLGGYSPRQDYLKQFPKTEEQLNKTNKIEYLDITIDSSCNLSCRMCTPHYSAPLEKTFRELDIPIDEEFLKEWKVKQKEFPKLLDKIKPHLSTIKKVVITGGEPFISKNTELLISEICQAEESKNMTIRFFTNISILPNWLPKLLEQVKSVELFMSIDGCEDFTSYIRHPLTWKQTSLNLDALCKLTSKHSNLTLRVHTVMQALNFSNLTTLIDKLTPYKEYFPFIPSFTYLDNPSCLAVDVLPLEFKKNVTEELVHFLEGVELSEDDKYYEELLLNISNVKAILSGIDIKNESNQFLDFILYNKKFDSLRRQSLFELIPELSKWKKA